ncbi:hypothetical protein [Sphingomonas sp. Leaf4]|uniref:hypothetical protein n=1 Tax=Sphingomonas sp. Leaf4 TaxID=2876553 RepID=UPI001E36EFCA|nr:hypothetical protein [Sphingomonas sp. Leaf4]
MYVHRTVDFHFLGRSTAGSAGREQSPIRLVIPKGHGDEDRSQRAETEYGHGKEIEEVALRIDPPHRQIEGQSGLIAAAFGLGIPLLLTVFFIGVYLRQIASTKSDCRNATLLYLAGALGALFAIHAAIN